MKASNEYMETNNKERIIRLEVQMEEMKKSLDDLTREVRAGFIQLREDSRSDYDHYATKEDIQEVKKAHRELTQKLWGVVVFILLAVIGAVLINSGIG